MEALSILASAFDGLLGISLLWLAWRALFSADLFRAVVLFIAFGLLLALAWVRLDAPDVALAEAGIGAGLTGALLIAALARLRGLESTPGGHETLPAGWSLYATALPALLVAAGLGYVVLSLPLQGAGLGEAVAGRLDSSGVSHPVTAVLLNFRGYDTLLEMAVLLLALHAVWSLDSAPHDPEEAPGVMLDTLARVLTPLLILVAAYLLWVGAHAPGGAFQAGSVLGAAGVLLLLSGWRLRDAHAGLALRLALVAGTAAFVVLAALTLWLEGGMLEYPLRHAGQLILFIEAAATVSIGVTLAALFLGGRPAAEKRG
jgi:multisubunit Na+/H+ antiporter MnhB subunit